MFTCPLTTVSQPRARLSHPSGGVQPLETTRLLRSAGPHPRARLCALAFPRQIGRDGWRRARTRGEQLAQYEFLSDEWLAEARKIREEYHGRTPQIPVVVRMNQIIQDVPFGEGVIHAHVDTSTGELQMETGHVESPDLTITLPYATAKAILVDGDAQAAMQAFMSGRIKVDGDITKMLALQTAGMAGNTDPAALELAKRLQDITA